MAGPIPEEQVARPAACQRWQSLTFLHWRYASEEVQRLLPPGLPPAEGAPLTHFSPGVDVRLGFPRRDGGVAR